MIQYDMFITSQGPIKGVNICGMDDHHRISTVMIITTRTKNKTKQNKTNKQTKTPQNKDKC